MHTSSQPTYKKVTNPILLQTIPEMIYETHMPLTTPTHHIEDIYDVGIQSLPLSPSTIIHDDAIVTTVYRRDRDYTDVAMVMGCHGNAYNDVTITGIHVYNSCDQTEDLYDDLNNMMTSGIATSGEGGPVPVTPFPYETFVCTNSKEDAPPPTELGNRQLKHQVQSEADLLVSKGPPAKPRAHRSRSADNITGGMPEAWVSRMPPRPRAVLVPRRGSTPIKTPPPLPAHKMSQVNNMLPPQIPPRQRVLSPAPKHRPLPSHPIELPPTQSSLPPEFPPHHMVEPPLHHMVENLPPHLIEHPPTQLIEPPPSYAAVLHSPEQFTLSLSSSPQPLPVLPPKLQPKPHPKPHPKPPHCQSEPYNVMTCNKSVLRKIASIPDTPSDCIMLFNGSNDQNITGKAKPYTFRTRFQ